MIVLFLIGSPASGKSFISKYYKKINQNSYIVSTDCLRFDLFGNEKIQGKWSVIERKIFKEIQDNIAQGKNIIYDATNAKRAWRMSFICKLRKVIEQEIDIIGWHLKTPLDVCKTWNKKRSRQVPEEVIEEYYQALKQFPPIAAEGFTAVYDVPYRDGSLDLSVLDEKLAKLSKTQTNRRNRTQHRKIEYHQYSRLLDFERLMYLISLLIQYPGLGNLQQTDPETLKNISGIPETYTQPIEEIAAVLSQTQHPIYADSEALQQDLDWLTANQLMGTGVVSGSLQLQTIELTDEEATHRYSDREPFTRLISTIRFILHNPFFMILVSAVYRP